MLPFVICEYFLSFFFFLLLFYFVFIFACVFSFPSFFCSPTSCFPLRLFVFFSPGHVAMRSQRFPTPRRELALRPYLNLGTSIRVQIYQGVFPPSLLPSSHGKEITSLWFSADKLNLGDENNILHLLVMLSGC